MSWGLILQILYPLAVIGFSAGAYWLFIRPKVLEVDNTLSATETAILSKGKTLFLSTTGMLAQVVAYIDETTVSNLSSVPWANILDAKTANFVTTACLLAIPVVHMRSVALAAKAVPVKDE
jgi:hypothetical protein